MHTRGIIGLLLALGVLTAVAPTAQAADAPTPEQAALDQTPPRLSFVDGQVSFWRPGAQDWAQAQVNTPLAPGDQLSTGSPGNLELQVGVRAFVRGRANTQIGLENQEPDYIQFKVTAGSAAFDLRGLERGQMVEVDTPNAAFTIEQPGYYRVEVAGEHTSFITRRTGRATVIPASGEAVVIAPSEEVVIEGTASPQVASYAAPKFDDWDKWNYARTNALLDAVSARHVSPGTYGVSDLDRYGSWRVVPEYGSVWVPTSVQSGWAPYTTGSWTNDPSYGWTWVDTAPWGWAPYHYGRWVSVNNYWAWAPGPVVARPVYAPALVAFFGGPSVSVGISIGGPVVGWVALGWGEPLVPWWGREGFRHRPSWNGWGGPRVVNNTVITNTTVVNVQNINVYRNSNVQNAVVVVNENRFGRGPITSARVARVDAKNLQLIHTAPQIAVTPASFVPTTTRGIRPPEESVKRSVVATRPPHRREESASGAERTVGPAGVPAPAPRIVTAPQQPEPASVLPRPPLGQSKVERPTADITRPPSPPGSGGPRRPEKGSEGAPAVTRQTPPQPGREPQVARPSPGAPVPPAATVQPPAAPEKQAAPQRPEKGKGAESVPPTTRQAPPPPPPGAPAVQPPAAPEKQAGPQRPEKGKSAESVPSIARQAPPQAGREPQATSPAPPAPKPPDAGVTAPPPSSKRPEAPRVASPPPAAPARPAAQPQPPASPEKQAAPQRPEKGKGAESVPPIARPAPPQAGREPQATSPAPPAPKPTAPGAIAAQPAPRRPEAATPPPRPLPGEPANRLAPNRAEKSPPRSVERKGSPDQEPQRKAPEGAPGEQPSGR